ncbi:uncharacterized protein AKAW2_30406A [Aspergillus luchuensis]|uniref:Similar to An08g06740 n=1 Tax=Aspergillus kawachii TaxID=1069201 RepID=A0A146FS33_ASPKA|nr:uncharacterized protein AKAW2_30406A [Aspergillus luchuensis]BCR97087.1 hypothetical protein AKAW2_30406A [Aspergillus luchuensis]BCS09561.1 hypothetical protein ALUC_30378A [Aspergillus luchuensis]GAA88609.1 similar to An08g06740 [Aspergillus luchuensis IFO 4308]GAT28610.1 similar to An08g06740 [Aspergillus luchuensis]
MRHHHHLTTISLLSLTLSSTATAASTIANIHPVFHNSCPPSPPPPPVLLSPRAHQHIPLQLHEGTCHPIPITSTHVSLDTQIEQFVSPAPNGDDNNKEENGGLGGIIPQHCNVTMHEQPGCVDEPFLAQSVHAGEFGRWVGSTCAEHHHYPRPRPKYPIVRGRYPRSGGDEVGNGNGNGKGNVWVLLECADASASASPSGADVHGVNQVEGGDGDAMQQQQQQDNEEEDKVGSVTHGGMVSATSGAGVNGTTGAGNNITSGSSLHAAMSNSTGVNSTSTLVHAPLNQTGSWRLMPRRKRGRFSIY